MATTIWLTHPEAVTTTGNLGASTMLSPADVGNIEHCLRLIRSWSGYSGFEAEKQSVIDHLMRLIDPDYDDGLRPVERN